MKYIVLYSGGKDSTAMLLHLVKKNYKIDEIVMHDSGWEFPQIFEHNKKVERLINRKITIVKASTKWDDYLKKYGWADMKNQWCTGQKIKDITNYLKKYDNLIRYIGIAYDERIRAKEKRGVMYPLINFKITQRKALKYCIKSGLDWNGLYDDFNRISCFCCPFKRVNELRMLYNKYPKLWKELRAKDKLSVRKFKQHKTLEQIEERYYYENMQLNLFRVNKQANINDIIKEILKYKNLRLKDIRIGKTKYIKKVKRLIIFVLINIYGYKDYKSIANRLNLNPISIYYHIGNFKLQNFNEDIQIITSRLNQ